MKYVAMVVAGIVFGLGAISALTFRPVPLIGMNSINTAPPIELLPQMQIADRASTNAKAPTKVFVSRHGYQFEIPSMWAVVECIDGMQLNVYARSDAPFNDTCDGMHEFGRLDLVGPIDASSPYWEPHPDQRNEADTPPRYQKMLQGGVLETSIAYNDFALYSGELVHRARVRLPDEAGRDAALFLVVTFRADDPTSEAVIKSIRPTTKSN